MKQPRTSDFDPSARERELKSPLTGFPPIEVSNHTLQESRLQDPVLPVRPVRVVPSASPVTGGKRKIKSRHPFDIYEDQLEELKQLALEDRMRGGAGSQSAMVREAIDDYIASHKGRFLDDSTPHS